MRDMNHNMPAASHVGAALSRAFQKGYGGYRGVLHFCIAQLDLMPKNEMIRVVARDSAENCRAMLVSGPVRGDLPAPL